MNKKDTFTTFSDWTARFGPAEFEAPEEVEGELKKGIKHDRDKNRAYQILGEFPLALSEIVTVGEYGAKKYSLHNWKYVEEGYLRYSDAMMRHILCEISGEVHDRESEILHAAHTAWNALARLQLLMEDAEGWKTNREIEK